jgi:hypothetical protein
MYLDSKIALVSKTVSVTEYCRGSVLIETKKCYYNGIIETKDIK